jgi:hypothetical protein
MSSLSPKARAVVVIFWILALAAIPLWIAAETPGWDLHVYANAIRSLRAGHDPYADGVAVQHIFHRDLALHLHAAPPMTYVYSPLTLPLLRIIASAPLWLSGACFWLAYIGGVLAQTWSGTQMSQRTEHSVFLFFAPAAAFFPGLIQHDVVLSGNIAYIFYGLILATAVLGWRSNRWHWFYLATLIASCCKAPLLSLLVIPILSTRKQWLPACVTGAIGFALFAIQPWLWPSAFHNYLEAIELQFSYNRDFGLSPAGLLGHVLFGAGVPYSFGTTVFYGLYALPVFALLLYLSRRFFAGNFSIEQWAPVMVLGVILLNPRIKEYDAAPLTLPMALVAWRFFASLTTRVRAIICSAALVALVNAVTAIDIDNWKITEGPLLVATFAAGSWTLLQQTRKANPKPNYLTESEPMRELVHSS